MKKKILTLLLVVILLVALAVPALAAQQRANDITLGMLFDGTTATCLVTATGDYTTDYIELDIELWQRNRLVATWTASGYLYVDVALPYDNAISGKNYTLKVYPTFNGEDYSMVSITRTCP